MGLLIYQSADPSTAFSASGGFTNPLAETFDGTVGGVVSRRFYVRNDESDRSYDTITLQPVYLSGDNIIDGTDGYSWKLIIGDAQPLEEQWSLVSPANSIVVPNIGTPSVADISTYEPFWLRMTVPRGAPVKSHQGVTLRLDFTETLVP